MANRQPTSGSMGLLGDDGVAVSTRSIRDPAQGIYEYLEERHEEQGVKIGCYLFPLRLSGWILRREGLLSKKFKKRFCVFEASTNELWLYADDNTTSGKLLRRLVVSRIDMVTSHESYSSVDVVGFEREKELVKDISETIRRRRTLSDGSSSVRLPGEQQRFYKAQRESLRTVSGKQAIVWSHCFRHHMRNWKRRQRLVRLTEIEESGRWDLVDDDELDELLDQERWNEEDADPEFSFHEQRVDGAIESTDARGRPVRRHVPQLTFDDESDVRISTSCRFSSLGANTGESRDGFPSKPVQSAVPVLKQPGLRTQNSRPSMSPSTRSNGWNPISSSSSSSDLFVMSSSSVGVLTRSHALSIWDDDDLLAHRVEFDAIKPTRVLSTGAFGEVWLARYLTQTIAVKKLKPASSASIRSRQRIQQFAHEIRLLSRLDHERIVSFVGVAWTMESDLQMLMEYMPYGDLRSYYEYLTIQRREKTAPGRGIHPVTTWSSQQWRTAVDIAEGLVYLHSFQPQLVHCDLKSRNLLLNTEMRVKIGDFGVARFIDSEDNTSQNDGDNDTNDSSGQLEALGTGRWIAPELLAGSGEYSPGVDVYSFGVVLSEIDTHNVPFHDKVVGEDGDHMSESVLLHHIMADGWTPSFSTHCPPEVLTIAQQCMAFHPEHRPTSLDVAHRLRKAMAAATNRTATPP